MYTVIAAAGCTPTHTYTPAQHSCVCAAFPLGYFPGTTFHGTDKAAMAAASVAADCAVPFPFWSQGKGFYCVCAESGRRQRAENHGKERAGRAEAGPFSARAKFPAASIIRMSARNNNNCPGANKIFDASGL